MSRKSAQISDFQKRQSAVRIACSVQCNTFSGPDRAGSTAPTTASTNRLMTRRSDQKITTDVAVRFDAPAANESRPGACARKLRFRCGPLFRCFRRHCTSGRRIASRKRNNADDYCYESRGSGETSHRCDVFQPFCFRHTAHARNHPEAAVVHPRNGLRTATERKSNVKRIDARCTAADKSAEDSRRSNNCDSRRSLRRHDGSREQKRGEAKENR